MGSAQRRIGPFNLGGYGIFSSLINGCNLIISQFLVPKLYFYFGFQLFPVFFFVLSVQNYILLYPFFLIDVYIGLIIVVWLMGLSIVFIIFSALSSCSKYSMLGCIRIVSQLISFELIWTTIIFVFIWSCNELSISVYWFFVFIWLFFVDCYFAMSSTQSMPIKALKYVIIMLWLVCYWIVINNYFFMFIFIICILAESNRVPYDLPEAESELVAGFITEYSAVIFSLILFTEYSNIIVLFFWLVIFLAINSDCLIFFCTIVCLIRTTLNRLKFDELMTNAWTVILPVIFALPILIMSFLLNYAPSI